VGDSWLRRILAVLAAAATIGVAAFYLRHWQFGYHSDTALIGLMARSILERGSIPGFRWPIFVWSVGYQGILFEVPAVAGALRLFGSSPTALHLVPTALFLVVAGAFGHAVRLTHGRTTALLACLFLAVGSPSFFFSVLRTQPNYGETFAFGMVLIALYLRLFARLVVAARPAGRGDAAAVAAFGFTAGFGLYTYGQIVIFLGCIAFHAGLAHLRQLRRAGWAGGTSALARELALPGFRIAGGMRGPARALNAVGLAALALGAASFLLARESIVWQGRAVAKWSALSVMFSALLALALLGAARALQLAGVRRRTSWRGLGIAAASFALGYAPALWHSLVLGLPRRSSLALGGDPGAVLRRAAIVGKGTLAFLNLVPVSPGRGAAALLSLALIGAFVAAGWRGVREAVRPDGSPAAALAVSPLLFLPAVVLPAVCASAATKDDAGARYALALVFFFALAFAAALRPLLAAARPVAVRLVALAALAVILANNATAIAASVRDEPPRHPLFAVADAMRRAGLRRAYGDYWYAYALSFLTGEEIVVEPLEHAYDPYYGPLVAAESRVGLLEPAKAPSRVDRGSDETVIRGTRYRASGARTVGEVRITVLEKVGG
jgi:hypothetical protein